MFNHAETAHLDTPKEAALRSDYEDACLECDLLKAELKRVRLIPLSEEAEAMFLWWRRAEEAQAILKKFRLHRHLSRWD